VLPQSVHEPHLLLVAGGTGIAPLRALLMDALRRNASLVPDLLYSARGQDDFAFGEELQALARAGRIGLHQTITRGGTDPEWPGTVGRIDRARLSRVLRDTATLCFVCGPHALVQEVPRALEELGVHPHRIRVEEWSA
jgi:ferredoxin-NADP reductase